MAGVAALVALGAVRSASAIPAAPPSGLIADVTFTGYPASARSPEILRRMLSPLAQEIIRRRLAASRTSVAEEALDPSAARFVVYVPPKAPPAGYGLLVFVPPWKEARLPSGWDAALDRRGVIYVSAAGSGNAANVFTRRVPLALVAAEEMRRRYGVDPARVYIGGFSGGARTALRIALAYPDLFDGALLNAGSDPIGESADPLPPADLFARFQTSTSVVFASGEADALAVATDMSSAAAMRKLCAFRSQRVVTPGVGHDVASPTVLARALDALEHPAPVDPARLESCRAALTHRVADDADGVAALIAAGRRDAARRKIVALDAAFGGLAASRIVGLAEACGCGIFPSDKRP
jgi:dienelactone hydrolase